MTTTTRLGLGLLALCGASAHAASAHAQACCSTTSTNEFAVVGRGHHAILASQLSYQHGLTSADADARAHPLGDSAYRDLVLQLGAGLRMPAPLQLVQVYGSVPLRLQHRRLGDAEGQTATHQGDAAAGVRWTVLTDTTHGIHAGHPRSYVPFLDLFSTVKAPTGRGPSPSRDPSAADVSGNGQWEVGLGAKVSKHLTMKDVVQAIGQHVLRRARSLDAADPAEPIEFSLGDLTQATLSYIRLENIFWSWGASTTFKYTQPARQRLSGADFRDVPDSDSRRVQVAAFLTHSLKYPHLDLSLSLAYDPPIDGLGKNLPIAGPSMAVKLGYNFVRPLF